MQREATTKAALARALGRSPRAVRKWAGKPTWPFPATGPWDVEAARTWMREHLGRPKLGGGESPGELEARLTLLRLRTEAEEIKYAALLRAYHPAAACVTETAQKLRMAHAALLAVAPRILAELRGRPEAAWPAAIDATVRAALQNLAGPEPPAEPRPDLCE